MNGQHIPHQRQEPRHALTPEAPAYTGDDTMLLPVIAPYDVPPAFEQRREANDYIRPDRPHPERFRKVLASMTETESRYFEPYLSSLAQKVGGRHSKLGAGPNRVSWATWIATEAGDDDMLAMLTQHNRTVAELNENPNIQHMIKGRKEWVANQITALSEEGVLSGDMQKTAKLLRDDGVGVWFGDDLRDYLLRSGGNLAYCTTSRDTVVLKQHLEITDPRKRQEAAVSGIYSNRLPHELLHTVHVAEWLPEWAVELAVEDINQTILHGGDMEAALDPNTSEGYNVRREIREALLTMGAEVVSGRDYIRAVSSRGLHTADARRFFNQLDRSWGQHDVLGLVTRHIMQHVNMYSWLHKGNPDINEFSIWTKATRETNRALREAPEQIFGQDYKKPQRAVGAAALAGSER